MEITLYLDSTNIKFDDYKAREGNMLYVKIYNIYMSNNHKNETKLNPTYSQKWKQQPSYVLRG